MFWRILLLAALALISIPITNVGLHMISEPSDVQVVVGTAILFGMLISWYLIVMHYSRYIKRRLGHAVVMAVMLALASTGCGRTVIEPGHVGITVDYYGQDRGVESYPKVTGVVWYNPISSTVLQYPVFVQTAVWTASPHEGNAVNEEITFTTGDQMQVRADISLAYHLLGERVPAFYVKFRSDDLRTFTHGFLRNLARDKFDSTAGRYRIEDIMGDNAKFMHEVRTALQAELTPIGVELDQFGFIGAPRPPDAVIASINAKVQATQSAIMVENQVRQTEAEARKTVAKAEGDAKAAIARAEGEAKANELLARSITPNLLDWRRLTLTEQAVARWNGARPMVEGGGSGLLLQLPVPK